MSLRPDPHLCGASQSTRQHCPAPADRRRPCSRGVQTAAGPAGLRETVLLRVHEMYRGAGPLPQTLPERPVVSAHAEEAGHPPQLPAAGGGGQSQGRQGSSESRGAEHHGAHPAAPEPTAAQRQPLGRSEEQRLPVPGPRHAGGGPQAGPLGPGGRLRSVPEGAGDVRGAAAGASLPPGQQDLHRPRGAAALPRLLLQGDQEGRGQQPDAAEGGVPDLLQPQAGARHSDSGDCH